MRPLPPPRRKPRGKRRRPRRRPRALQLRKQKQDELVKLGQEIQYENHHQGVGGMVPAAAETNASPIAYLSDPRNYQAIREKQAIIEREKSSINK